MSLAEKYKDLHVFAWEAEKEKFLKQELSQEDELYFVRNTDARVVSKLLGIQSIEDVMKARWSSRAGAANTASDLAKRDC